MQVDIELEFLFRGTDKNGATPLEPCKFRFRNKARQLEIYHMRDPEFHPTLNIVNEKLHNINRFLKLIYNQVNYFDNLKQLNSILT